MPNLILVTASLLVVAGAADAAVARGAAVATAPEKATCAAKYYDYLVGRDLTETRAITADDYRAVASDAAAPAQKPKRVTFIYDKKSNRITEVGCG